MLAGFVLARASAGLADATIRGDVGQLEQIRAWFGRPLWEMEPADADAYFGRVLRGASSGTRLARAQALTTYFVFVELRHKVELHAMTGRVVECPIDEMNRPRGRKDARLRIPPAEAEIAQLFAGWSRSWRPAASSRRAARNYTAARLMAEVGLRVNEARSLDLADIKWDLGRFGKLHVRYGKGARGSGPRERMVPLVNDAGADTALVHRGRVGPVRRRPHPARRAAVPLGTQERRRVVPRGSATTRCVRAGRRGRRTSAGLGGQADPARAAALLRLAAVPDRSGPDLDPGVARAFLDRHHDAVRPRAPHPNRGGWVAGQQRAAKRLEGLLR